MTGCFTFGHVAASRDLVLGEATDGVGEGETRSDPLAYYSGSTGGHYEVDDSIVEVRWGGHHYIGDTGIWDVDGHSIHAGCVDDAPKVLDHKTSLPESESVSTSYVVAVERVAAFLFDLACGVALKVHAYSVVGYEVGCDAVVLSPVYRCEYSNVH